ncbi:DUF3885 domain-containing protein [Lysinibacillus xylanilyticus]|uniref:DUF3885 domain-containing protein n=1 Tax=Lysinibacillus xylanilyticus TaxID=582475 RepID=UPI002B254625|nr:DUF3885 domain-containing protein [Lysinibacillus xylanilyticus]MEB2282949.1 DUF3885 domain-containing protein [Lysinibacillus xylanilyticus]
MKENIMKYIESHFPNLTSELHLRFELGEPYENGTEDRLNQVVKRVTTLFEEVFKPDDSIYMYIKDWEVTEDIMFGNTTPEYLYSLLIDQNIEEETLLEIEKDYDEVTSQTIEVKNEYKVKFVYSQLKSVPYQEILKGIGNYEQGREPSIGQSVYFISTDKNLIFHMYDDRGCLIHSKDVKKLLPLYHTYNNWLVDYWRDYFDSIFKMA